MIKKISTALTALILCFAVIFSSTVIPASAYAQPDKVGDDAKVIFIFVSFRSKPDFAFSSIKTLFLIGRKVKVLGYEGFFTYVEDAETKEKGYIFSDFLKDDEEGSLSVNESDFSAFVGAKRISLIKINYTGNKNVNLKLSKTGIVEVTKENDGNLSIKGISPGTVTLTISAGLESETCTLNCVYKWKKLWTGKANKNTTVYKGAGSGYDVWADISEEQKFIVYGDNGSSDGWAYGNVEGTNTWGFVKINDISTKGTVSQYNNMNWTYPIKDTKFKNIFSVYGWRGNSRHLGFDINKTPYTTIQGEEAVSTCKGKVVFVNKTYNYSTKKPDYGYCVIIESETEDPVSGNKLRVVYMHLNEPPNLSLGNELTPGQKIGFIGTTGNSTGPHLHLEINNKGTNFAGSYNSDSFDKTINPIFFYMNSGLKDSSDSTYDEYWYNNNK